MKTGVGVGEFRSQQSGDEASREGHQVAEEAQNRADG